MTEDQTAGEAEAAPLPEFTLTVTYPAADLQQAEWLAEHAVTTLRCDPTTADWKVAIR